MDRWRVMSEARRGETRRRDFQKVVSYALWICAMNM